VRGTLAPPTDEALLDGLRRGDQRAFTRLVERYHAQLLRVARLYLRDAAAAEEIAQDTWLAVLTGIDRFEGRASFKTWLFRILANKARTRWTRDRRALPFSSLAGDDPDGAADPSVEPERFFGPGHRWAGHWTAYPQRWAAIPEDRLMARETLDVVRDTIAQLPPRQRQVIVLRDVEGWEPEDVCDALEISDGNHRILLHRARSRVRAALERYFEGEGPA
jgi:RNA polymerase sigma-70 factor (ECF subfamily)